MWTANLVHKRLDKGKLIIVIEYTDGKTTFEEDTVLSTPNVKVKEVAANRIDELNKLADYEKDLKLGDIDLTPDPVVTPTPTPIEAKKSEYRSKLALLISKNQLVDLGVITETEADLSTLRADLKSLYTAL